MRIIAPRFVAGLIIKNDVVINAAPILKYMIGWSREQVIKYIKSKGWEYD